MDVPPSQPQIPAIPGKKRKFFCNFFGGEFLEKKFFYGRNPRKKTKNLLDFLGGFHGKNKIFFFLGIPKKKKPQKILSNSFGNYFFPPHFCPNPIFIFYFPGGLMGIFPFFPQEWGFFQEGFVPLTSLRIFQDFLWLWISLFLMFSCCFPLVFPVFSPFSLCFFPPLLSERSVPLCPL